VDRGDGASTVGAATVAATATRRRLCDCEQLQRWNRWRFFYRNRFTTIALLSFTAVVQLWLLSTSIVTKAMVRVPKMRHRGFFFFSRPTGLLQRSDNVM